MPGSEVGPTTTALPCRRPHENALALLDTVTALARDPDTHSGVPNAAPPPPRRPDGSRPGPAVRARSAVQAAPARQGAAPDPRVPSSWTGAAALLAHSTAVRPGGAPVNAVALPTTQPRPLQVDLSGMWAPAAHPGAPTSSLELRRLDDTYRLMLPIVISDPAKLPAQRDHAVLTVSLPGAPGAPAPDGRLPRWRWPPVVA